MIPETDADALAQEIDDDGDVTREREARIRQMRIQHGLIKLMNDEEGRAWIWDVLSKCRIFYSGFSSDPLVMAQLAGIREIGLDIFGQIQSLCPAEYQRMASENKAST